MSYDSNRYIMEHMARIAGHVRILLLLTFTSISVITAGCATGGSATKGADQLADEWGVEITSLRLTAADYMIDFRYRVIDSEKATQILDRTIKPHMIVERTGVKLQVPISGKMGPLRQATTNPIDGRIYFTFFANPARHVVAGDTVTVVVGDFKVEHLTVL